MASRWMNRLVDAARSVLTGPRSTTTQRTRPSRPRPVARPTSTERRTATSAGPAAATSYAYPGDFHGVVRAHYDPHPDGAPDPGEIVWTWVPYEEDQDNTHNPRGKDRPVLLIGRDGPWLLGLQLTSQDHDRDAAQEARWGRLWMDIGTGAWDSQRRPSEVRINRVLRVDPQRVRREGAVLDRKTFDAVVAAMHKAGQ